MLLKTEGIRPYPRWGCFTSTADTSLRNKAETLIKKTKKSKDIGQFRSACLNFVRGWRKMPLLPSYAESGVGDSAVRENVKGFLEAIAAAKGYSETWAEDVWNEALDPRAQNKGE